MEGYIFIKLLLARTFRNIRGPLFEIEIKDIRDRLANKIAGHEILETFNMDLDNSALHYSKYNRKLHQLQDGEWLRGFLGYSKKIPYWLTPWGGCLKDHSKKDRLSLSHAKQYAKSLKDIRDSIRTKGYSPEKYGYITGQILINDKGEKRFIIWNGHRRILSLASLNYKKVVVEVSGGDRWEGGIKNHFIDTRDISKWNNIKSKLYSIEEGRKIFNKFFE